MKVLVITARGLQAGALGCYGNPWIDTPTLDALAATGVVCDWHFADAADPAGARRAWRTGQFPKLASGGCQPPVDDQGVNTPRSPDLLAALRDKQVFTFLIVDQSRPAPREFEAGWDEVAYAEADEEGSALEVALDVARSALEDLAPREQWLLWLDLATLLPPWEVPEEILGPYFQEDAADDDVEDEEQEQEEPDGEVEPADVVEDEAESADEVEEPLEPLPAPPEGPIDPADDALFLRIQTTYAAAVTCFDFAIAQLLDALRAAGLDDDTLVIVTSDVGQALGEHGVVGPVRPWLHEEVIHLPLMVRLPKSAEAGRRVAALTQAIDLAPTLADAFDVALAGADGVSLLSVMRGQSEKVRDHAIAGVQINDGSEYCLRTPEWAFLLPVQPHPDAASRAAQLYVKPDDRCEVNDVIQHHPELAEEFTELLRRLVK